MRVKGQRFGKVACQHGDVFLKAEDVTEREADKFYIVVLDEIEDVLLCRITHRCVSSEKVCLLKKRPKACLCTEAGLQAGVRNRKRRMAQISASAGGALGFIGILKHCRCFG